ncbi:tetratricopeptide repeat protein [bacterium]|nr:tetratricopeptide repeat protein [bacterium]
MEQAITAYQTAIQLKPDFAEAHVHLAQSLLLSGDLQNGFAEYEWRWAMIAPYAFSQPVWDGSSLAEKTILVWIEAGFGDIIQFIRYIPLVKAYRGQVFVSCRTTLKRLLETMDEIDRLILEGETLPEFDVHVPLMSIPQIVGTTLETIPAHIPYLSPPVECRFKLKPLPDTTLNVGIVWASGYKTVEGVITKITNRMLLANQKLRSCPLSMFVKLLEIPGISFYSLQVGENIADLAALGDTSKLQDLSTHIQDFADTAALIGQMDLVISVDTAAAHLAGALGKPAWVLLPVGTDWRWLLDRNDSPWYPTMRLFRQRSPGDWEEVLDRVAEALKINY